MNNIIVFFYIIITLLFKNQVSSANEPKNISCFENYSSNENYELIINNFEITFEENLKSNTVNLVELSNLHFCYYKLKTWSRYQEKIEKLIQKGLLTNNKYKINVFLLENYGFNIGNEILFEQKNYHNNKLLFQKRIDNLIEIGKFLEQGKNNYSLEQIIAWSKIENLHLDNAYRDKYIDFLNNIIVNFEDLNENIYLFKLIEVKLKLINKETTKDVCASFFNKEVTTFLNKQDILNNINLFIDLKIDQSISSIYQSGIECVSRLNKLKSLPVVLKYIELLEFFRENSKDSNRKKIISNDILIYYKYLHQISIRAGNPQHRIYQKTIFEKLNNYPSTELVRMEIEADLIKEIYLGRNEINTEEDKFFLNRINSGLNKFSKFTFSEYLKEAPYTNFTTKEQFQGELARVQFKYMDMYSYVLTLTGNYIEAITLLRKEIKILESAKQKYSKDLIINTDTFNSILPELYERLIFALFEVKEWSDAQKVLEDSLEHCELLPSNNYKCYGLKLAYLKNTGIKKEKKTIVNLISDIDIFYKVLTSNEDYQLYNQSKKDRFFFDYLTYRSYGLVNLQSMNVVTENFNGKSENIKNIMCANSLALHKLANNSKNNFVNNPKNILGALMMTSSCYKEFKSTDIGEEYYKLSEKIIEDYKKNINIEDYSDYLQKTSSGSDIPLITLQAISINQNHPKYEKTSKDLFEIMQKEEAKFYYKSKKNLLNQKYPELQNKINQINILKIKYENLISKAYLQENKFLDESFIENKSKLEKNILKLNKEIKDNFPQFKKLNFNKTYSVSEIQKKLGKNDALIYLSNTATAMSILITNDKFSINLIPELGSEGNFHQTTKENLRKNLLDSVIKNNNNISINSTKITSAILYQQFLKPLETYIANKKNLYFITDKYLSDIPFELLVTNKNISNTNIQALLKEGFEAEYLIEKFSIKYLPNTASLMEFQKSSLTKNQKLNLSFLGVGNPRFNKSNNSFASININLNSRGYLKDVDKINLNYEELPFTAKELLSLKSIFNKNTILEQGEATEGNVKSLVLKDFNILHFATHAEVSNTFDDFNEPFLVLTPPIISNEKDDGLLTTSEISNLNLDAYLVILSACDTGAKKNQYASGFSGLISSFLLAGTNSVVATHWPVEDNAGYVIITETMKKFINSDLDFAEALRITKIEFIKGKYKNNFKNPFFWASYIYVGL